MTTRERRERRAERREEWAEKRRAKESSAFDSADELASQIPLGQPILVGHHSEKRARRDVDRIHSRMSAGVEHGRAAEKHEQAAKTIRRQLDASIYSDDADAIEKLEAKIVDLEAQRDRFKAINSWIRKNRKRFGFSSARLVDATEHEESQVAGLLAECSRKLPLTVDEQRVLIDALSFNRRIGIPSYATTNLAGNISRARKRLDGLRAAQR